MIDWRKQYNGKEYMCTCGTICKIIEYKDAQNVLIEFQDEYRFRRVVKLTSIKRGNIKNPYWKTVYGIGMVGNTTACKDGNVKKSYRCWYNIIGRCNLKEYQENHIYYTYKDVEVCSDWLMYENFEKWYDKNNWNSLEDLELDKDILVKGNKIYSPEACVFVPQRINVLFTNRKNKRGMYLIGVDYRETVNKYYAKLNCIKHHHIGCFNTELEAFYAYKNAKESYIKQVAEEYKSKYPNFPQKLYDAMYSYKIEIDD